MPPTTVEADANYSRITEYIRSVKELDGAGHRSQRFSTFLQDAFGVLSDIIGSHVKGLEQSVWGAGEGRVIRGAEYSLYGNLVIEFRSTLPRQLEDAKRQLTNYIPPLRAQLSNRKHPWLLIASDGLRFYVFFPMADGTAAALRLMDCVDIDELDDRSALNWLSRYFCPDFIETATGEALKADFGPGSHALARVIPDLLAIWQSVSDVSSFNVIYENWARHLSLIYGSQLAAPELFVTHTYLATLAKLIGYCVLTKDAGGATEQTILDVLSGAYFKRAGIPNYIDHDYFFWVSRPEILEKSFASVKQIASVLRRYEMSRVSQDLMKPLYQQLVDPATRHDLGEYYTPDWLAERMVEETLSQNPERTVLDPACGSGTFLLAAIKLKRQALECHNDELLNHILASVAGADVHPLAVMIAKTNYLVAIKDLVQARRLKKQIYLPVYLADMLRLPEQTSTEQRVTAYCMDIEGRHIAIPSSLLENWEDFDSGVDLSMEFAAGTQTGGPTSVTAFRNLLNVRRYHLANSTTVEQALIELSATFASALRQDRDGIWPFVVKNMYRPLLWFKHFDVVIGNPPWIAFRSLDKEYQNFVRRQLAISYKVMPARSQLVTHLELAMFFFLRAADLYLKAGGSIGFIMPRTLLNADQYDSFRRKSFDLPEHYLLWHELWDCEKTTPIFSVPACVLFALKRDTQDTSSELNGMEVAGKLPTACITWSEARNYVSFNPRKYNLQEIGKRRSAWTPLPNRITHDPSAYGPMFTQGACLFPRNFWFVDAPRPSLGFSSDMPFVRSHPPGKAGPNKAYRDLIMSGTIESDFLFCTLRGAAVLPFCHMPAELLLLPIRANNGSYDLVSSKEARLDGYLHLADWLDTAELSWSSIRGAKAKDSTLVDWINAYKKLTKQQPDRAYLVVYPNIQRISTACVIDVQTVIREAHRHYGIAVKDFVLESALYGYETRDLEEAHYLCAILNSPILDGLLLPLRQRNQKSQPNVHKKIFDVAPIPLFDRARQEHMELAELSKAAETVARRTLSSVAITSDTGKMRQSIRKALVEEMAQINAITKAILRVHPF